MFSAVVLVCNLAMIPIFEQNKIVTHDMMPPRSCYFKTAPKLGANEAECMFSIGKAFKDPDFAMPGFQIFSFHCFEWKNHWYKGVTS